MDISDRRRARAGFPHGARPSLSLLIPVFNEEENIPILFGEISRVMSSLPLSYEVVVVNDGSTDGSLAAMQLIAAADRRVKIVDFPRNLGQTAAMMAAIDHASGDILVSLDADLQNDVADIPLLLSKMEEGYDVVSGWRKDRQDHALRRNLVSQIANRVISRVSGVFLHDYGCTLKAYRRDVIKGVRLYGEMHRFVPIYASWQGGKITEVVVRHHPRRFGKSKYGLERVVKVILDLLVVKFLHSYFAKPIYVFGGFGLCSLGVALLAFITMLFLKIGFGISMIMTPLPLLIAITILVGFMSILMGLLAEMLVRTYFESQGQPSYLVRSRINFDEQP